MSNQTLRFNDLSLREEVLRKRVEKALSRVLDSSQYVLGPEVAEFENEFASMHDCGYGIGTASGTDALSLALMALGVGEGDEVVTSPLTAVFTAIAISRVGATPVFADVEEDTLTLSPAQTERMITSRTKAIVPVHLYGNACDMEAFVELSKRTGVALVEDACQAHAGRYRGKAMGSFGAAGVFSFYPTKNLGALGDGGCVVTNNEELASKVRLLRNGGQTNRYTHQSIGLNSRLDELQAAVLREKLPYLEEWNQRRRQLSILYENGLSSKTCRPLVVRESAGSARHLFVVRTELQEGLLSHLHEQGIECLVHYPVPVHLQPAYLYLERTKGSFPVAEVAARSVVSLPLYPAMGDEEITRVIDVVGSFSEKTTSSSA